MVTDAGGIDGEALEDVEVVPALDLGLNQVPGGLPRDDVDDLDRGAAAAQPRPLALLFNQPPDFWLYVGAPIVIGSGLYIWLRERKLHKAAIAVDGVAGR